MEKSHDQVDKATTADSAVGIHDRVNNELFRSMPITDISGNPRPQQIHGPLNADADTQKFWPNMGPKDKEPNQSTDSGSADWNAHGVLVVPYNHPLSELGRKPDAMNIPEYTQNLLDHAAKQIREGLPVSNSAKPIAGCEASTPEKYATKPGVKIPAGLPHIQVSNDGQIEFYCPPNVR